MRFVIFMAGAAMAASYIVAWAEAPFAGPDLSPASLIGDDLSRIIQEGPWQAWVFLGGFALAALSAAVALLGRASGILSLLAGLSPAVLGVHFYLRAEELEANLGLPFEIDLSNLGQAWELTSDFIRTGLWMYLGGAAVLLLAGMAVSFGRN